MAGAIKVKCLRPMLFDGKPIAAGAVLTLSPLAAADAVASGRAEYVDAAAAAIVREAVKSATQATLRGLAAPGDAFRYGRIGRAA